MKQYDLTEQGAADKLAELYALSDPALAIQAAAIAMNFKGWLKNSFNLTTEQDSYIDGMNSGTAFYFGAQCSICFLFRLPITLVYPPPPTSPGYTKWTGSESSVRVSTDGSGNTTATGSLTFTISYVY